MADFKNIPITPTTASRLADVDLSNLGFGDAFSDHMFSLRFVDGQWADPQVMPYGPIPLEPGCLTLHYGQSVFEGLKAFRGVDGKVRVFRADRNEARLADSCERLCIPPLPTGVLNQAIDNLLRLDHAWIPKERGAALYIRPLVFAEESHLSVRPSNQYRALIMTAPVGNYYSSDVGAVSLKVQNRYTRAAPGGLGYAKTAANYAASLLPGEQSRQEGFQQALWLDGAEHRYVEEAGHMNIFFHIDEQIVTPELRGSILPGVTRDSVITILRDRGYEVVERRISIDEVVEASSAGRLREAFGSGTATVIAPIGQLSYNGQDHVMGNGEPGLLSQSMYDEIIGIQTGEIEDQRGWTREVDVLAEPLRELA